MVTVTVQQRGLGKGLSALISEQASQPLSTPKEKAQAHYELAVGKLLAGKFQPRSRFDDEHLRELSVSIEKNGIMQPILVRPSTEYPGKYEIIAGERRWRAAKMAKLANVPVVIREISDQQALELALVENIQRQDLSPLEEAVGYQRLIQEFNYTQEELAHTIGKSRSHIANLLRLLTLPDKVKALLEEGALTMGHARALLNVENPLLLATQIVKQKWSVREAEEAARMESGAEKQARPRVARGPSAGRANGAAQARSTAPKDPDIIVMEQSLSEQLGLKLEIHHEGEGGSVEISYGSLNELDRILQLLGSAA